MGADIVTEPLEGKSHFLPHPSCMKHWEGVAFIAVLEEVVGW